MLGGSSSKRKAKTFKDEEYFISSVPTNRVGSLSLMPSDVNYPAKLIMYVPYCGCMLQSFILQAIFCASVVQLLFEIRF